MIKKRLLSLVLIMFSLSLISCSPEKITPLEESTEEALNQELPIYGDEQNHLLVTFEVTVPENTLEDDIIYLGLEDFFVEIGGEFSDIPMQKIGESKWGVIYKARENNEIRYVYNRNNDRNTREVRDNFRILDVKDKELEIRDTVNGWRWDQEDLSKNLEMTFIVNVPENTPEEDIVYIHPYNKDEIKMEKTGTFRHKITLSPKDFAFVADERGDNIIWYRYTRNGWDYITSEFLEPDNSEHYWTKRGRETFFEPGKIQEDAITRWRWFPEDSLVNEDISYLKVPDLFPARIDNTRFRSGQGIQDLFIKGFDDFFNTTAQHMKEVGYEWVVFFPAWQWEQQDPLPKLNNDFVSNPNYPDTILIKQMKEYKEHGINIILAPQVCCTDINTEGRAKDWWQEYFNEIKRFLVHHAKLAEEAGADAFMDDFARTGISEGYGSEVVKIEQNAWSGIWDEIRKVYSGEIGQMIWNFGNEFGGLSPDADFITWSDKLDFFYVQSEAELSESSHPTEEQLLAGANHELDVIQKLYDKHSKPVILQSGFHSIKESWHGFKEIDLVDPECGESESEIGCDKIYSQTDQARAIHAYFTSLKDRPWIIGYFNFGYEQYILPMLPGWSIRGKAAENLWRRWNEAVYGNSSNK